MNEKITRATDKLISEAVYNIADRLPDDESKKDFVRRVEDELQQGMSAALVGQDYQQHLNRSAYETSVWVANHYADIALNKVIKEMPRGKTRDTIHNALEQLAHRGIESFCRGASLNEIKSELADYAVDMAVNRAVAWGKEQGEDIAKKSFKKLASEATKRFGKNVGSDMLNRLANSNGLITTAGAAIDIAQSLDKMIDGKMTAAEFIELFTRKGIDIVVQNAATIIGTAVGGAIGGLPGAAIGQAIGAAINYAVSNFLNSVVMSIRRSHARAEAAQRRREYVEAINNYAIEMMRQQRAEFERIVGEYLAARRQMFNTYLDNYERAMERGDYVAMDAVLEDINRAVGGSRLPTDDELEDDDFVLKL